MPGKTLADWTEADLLRWLQGVLRQSKANLPPSLELNELTTYKKLTVADQLRLSPQAIAYLHQVMGV